MVSRRGSSRGPISYRRNNFIRSIGLELLTLIGFGHSVRELPKPVIETAIGTVLSRSVVHVLPILASITIITINLKNVFLGRTLTGSILNPAINIAFLQVAAKIQELLIIASLTTIVVHTIREQLLFRDGVPFGILGGAFLFSSLSYFWSPEFWGSMKWKTTAWTKFRLYSTLVASGFLATAAGPSSAVLLIPRDQSFVGGGSDMFFRGSMAEIWPSQLSFSADGPDPFCSYPNATEYALCPSGGYQSLRDYQKTLFPLRNYIGLQQNISSFSLAGTTFPIQSTLKNMHDTSLSGNWRSYACQTSTAGVHSATAVILSELLGDWLQTVLAIPYNPITSSISQYKYYDSLSAEASTRLPMVRVACSDAQNLSAYDNKILFPVMPEVGCWNSTDVFAFQSFNTTSKNNLKTTWVSLPEEFGTVSTGMIFEAPWTNNRSSRVVLGCSVDARWTNGSVKCDSKGACLTTGITNLGPAYGNSDFRPLDNTTWSPISLQRSWLNILTPYMQITTPEQQIWNATTLESILANAELVDGLTSLQTTQTNVWNKATPGALNRTITLEWIISAIVTDGLSRQGSTRVFNTTGPISTWTILDYNKTADFGNQLLRGGSPIQKPTIANVSKNRVFITITGYSYKAGNITDYLSIAVLFVHIVFALGHIIQLLVTGHSSGCWDTITELLALMHRSQPAPTTLKNTCAGIKELTTYAQVAVIRAIHQTNNNGTDAPHVEAVFLENPNMPIELRDLLEHSPVRSVSPSHAKTWSGGASSTYLDATTTGYKSADSNNPFSVQRGRGRQMSDIRMEMVQANALYG